MKLLSSLLLAVIAIGITACKCSTKSWDCPGYNSAELNAWFPYADSTLLIYTNGSGISDTIHLLKTELSQPYSVGGASRVCDASKLFESKENLTPTIKKLSIQLQRTDVGTITNKAWLAIRGYKYTIFQGVTASELGTAKYDYNIPFSIQYLSSINLSGRAFSNVAEAVRDTTNFKTAGVYKIYIAKNVGLVGYEEYPSQTLWVLQ